MRYLRPLRLKISYYSGIETTINLIFYTRCFAPIVKAFEENSHKSALVQNANDPISTALRQGKIFYFDGKFTGQFDAKISAAFKYLGAKFNLLDKSWKLPVIPPHIQSTLADVNLRMEKIKSDILRNLDKVPTDKDFMQQQLTAEYLKTVNRINEDFLETIKGVTIAPILTEQAKLNISKNWAQNLELYINKWTAQNILKLREEVATNTYRGQRAEGLIKNIQTDYGVSRRKAKFLARQETSLLMSKMREERYKDAGITQYKWSGVMDERERPDHKLLEDNVYSWDNPPIVDRTNGRKANPGEDFGCRCVAIPIVN
jgi:SPP1 gp7 family putative phage head morphogenesis protein